MLHYKTSVVALKNFPLCSKENLGLKFKSFLIFLLLYETLDEVRKIKFKSLFGKGKK